MAEDAVRTRLLQNMYELQDRYREAEKEKEEQDPGALLASIWTLLSGYHGGDDPYKAVYLIAKATVMIEPLGRIYGTISTYKEYQKKLEEYDMRRTIENG